MIFYVYSEDLNLSEMYRYACFLLDKLKDDIDDLPDDKFKVRYDYIVDNFIKWNIKPKSKIDLKQIVKDSFIIQLYDKGYCIMLDPNKIIPFSSTKYSTVVRLIEYGNEKITAYPFLHKLFNEYYLKFDNELYEEYLLSYFAPAETKKKRKKGLVK